MDLAELVKSNHP